MIQASVCKDGTSVLYNGLVGSGNLGINLKAKCTSIWSLLQYWGDSINGLGREYEYGSKFISGLR